MNLTVHYEYDDHHFFPKNYRGDTFLKFDDPPFVPATGDKVHLRLDEFIDDPAFVKAYNAYTEGKVFIAERVHTFIGKDETEVIIILHEESEFKKTYPALAQS